MPSLDRRDFLRMGAAPVLSPLLGLGRADAATRQSPDVNCIFLMLVGGPSQIDTWDPKPDAPLEIRGLFKPIRTNVAGIEISEIFPRMAQHAEKYALIRSCYHTGEPVHEIGHQLVQTGRLIEEGGIEHPHIGCVISDLDGRTHTLLPGPIGKTGGNLSHGQTAGFLGSTPDPRQVGIDLRQEPDSVRDRYGRNVFGQNCLRARRLVESGTRFVTVNMFETVFGQATWDIHGYAPFSPMSCYRDCVGPMFDMAYSALLEDLSQRGHLANTLIVATGEFGRTPKINSAGGRDHWPECWTMLMAGGGVQGGQIIGSSDRTGSEPKDRPVSPKEIAASIYHALGIDYDQKLPGSEIPLVDPGTRPVWELFG